MGWTTAHAGYEGARRSPLHWSLDVRASSPMMQQPHQRANSVSPLLVNNSHYHAAPYYSHYHWNAGYHPHAYTNNCLPPYESPSPQHPHYIQASPDARLSPPKEFFQTESQDTTRAAGCTCKKSRCLKLYCQCFGSSTTCGNRCRCQNCHNNMEHAKDIEDAKRAILDRNPSAFENKFQGGIYTQHSGSSVISYSANLNWRFGQPGNSQQIQQNQTLPTPQNGTKLGCRCRRSFCLKKYCECFQNQMHCGLHCGCLNCKNHPSQTELLKKTPVAPAVTTKETPSVCQKSVPCVKDENTPEKLLEDSESEDDMTMIAAVAMTELFGKTPRRVSVDTSKTKGKKRKFRRTSEMVNLSTPPPDETDSVPSQKSRRVLFSETPATQREISRNPLSVHPMNPAASHASPFHPHFTLQQEATGPFPYHFHPLKPSLTYKDVIKTSGLPRALSFRKICSKCGRTRGEHAELGFGNKCVFNDCARCGAHRTIHQKHGSPMGILCSLSVKEGATPGQADKYERKIRDLAARAELQKSLKGKASDE